MLRQVSKPCTICGSYYRRFNMCCRCNICGTIDLSPIPDYKESDKYYDENFRMPVKKVTKRKGKSK